MHRHARARVENFNGRVGGTLKEQAIFGQIFHTAAEVRAARSEFVARYNNCWRLARLGFRSNLDRIGRAGARFAEIVGDFSHTKGHVAKDTWPGIAARA